MDTQANQDKQITNRLQNIFRTFFKDDLIILSKKTTAQDIEEWDSLSHLDLINYLENQFKISFTFEEILIMKNIGDLVEIISKKIN
jgi:acyl carrier protein